jgi:hypothetical protein
MTKYRAWEYHTSSSDWVDKIEVTRETEQTVWFKINGVIRSERKNSDYYRWFDNSEDARVYLINKWDRKISQYEKCAKDKQNELQELLMLEENKNEENV